MATNGKEFADISLLLDFIGADEDSSGIVAKHRKSSMEELFRATGIHWESEEDNDVAEELIMLSVYLAYYGQRGGIQNTEYIERRRIQLMQQLQNSKEVTGYGKENI